MDAFTALAYIVIGVAVGFGAMWLYCRMKGIKNLMR